VTNTVVTVFLVVVIIIIIIIIIVIELATPWTQRAGRGDNGCVARESAFFFPSVLAGTSGTIIMMTTMNSVS